MRRRGFALLALALAARAGDPPPRYTVEIIYTVHKKVDEAAYKRIEKVFKRTWPGFDLKELKPRVSSLRTHYNLYTDRLLEEAGTRLEKLDPPAGGGGGRRSRLEIGYEIVKEQMVRELHLRRMYQRMHEQARKTKKPLADLFKRMKRHDDPKRPVLGTLIVYRKLVALTAAELEDVTDNRVRFTHTFRHRIARAGLGLCRKAGVFGSEGHGRMIFRVVAVDRDELHAVVRKVLLKEFPEGLESDFKTRWRYKMTKRYRDSTRVRAQVKLKGNEITVAVVKQINDNIDDPSSIEQARWVGGFLDRAWADRIERAIRVESLRSRR